MVSAGAGRHARAADHQWDPGRFLVGTALATHDAMLAEEHAVVGQEHDVGIAEDAVAGQSLDDRREAFIHRFQAPYP